MNVQHILSESSDWYHSENSAENGCENDLEVSNIDSNENENTENEEIIVRNIGLVDRPAFDTQNSNENSRLIEFSPS